MAYDFEANVDARYTDTLVEAKITIAERWINGHCGQTFSGTIPDGVIYAVTLLSKYHMVKQMIEDGHLDKERNVKFSDVFAEITAALKDHKLLITDAVANDLWQQ